MQDYRNLNVWNKSYKFILDIYLVTKKYPKDELFGVVSQLRRATISIAANISEGAGKNTKADFRRYIQISLGSTNEVEFLLTLSKDLKYISESEYRSLVENLCEIRKMLVGLNKSIK